MRTDARVQASIEIVDTWLGTDAGLDQVLARWGRSNRYAGSGDRHAIADLVYDAVRRLRSAHWVSGIEGEPTGRSALIGSLLLDNADLDATFTGLRHAPAPIGPSERNARPLASASTGVRFDMPDWLLPYLDGIEPDALAGFRARAALDLRVNTLKTTPDQAREALKRGGIDVEPGPLSPLALRVTAGQRRVARSEAYLDGLVEIQDAASIAVSDLAAPMAGETVLDLCAGGGGKSLALAALASNQAEIYAYDVSRVRLQNTAERAARSGACIRVLEREPEEMLRKLCDIVFVDAPCSGMGAWRRNPDAKWRLSPNRLNDLTEIQSRVLERAAALTRPGGRIAFATCSMIHAEGPAQIDAFLHRNMGWEVAKSLKTGQDCNTDGFFASVLINKKG